MQKYGGTSVADSESVKNVARRVIKTREAGNDVVVVVSAPGNMTDELIELAHEITDSPPAREMDMLLATGEQRSIALLAMAKRAGESEKLNTVALSGGVFCNRYLTNQLIKLLKQEGFCVLFNRSFPSNDGGVSLGQAAIAAKLIKHGM